MVEIAQVVTQFSGFQGAPGFNSLYFFGDPVSPSTLQGYVDAAGDFWNGVAPQMAQGWTFQIQPDVSILDPATGALIRVQGSQPPAQSVFGTAGVYAGGVGACVTWSTAAVHGKKRLQGRTFVVPMSGSKYQEDGTIATQPLADLRTHAATLQSHAGFGVWGRPRAADPNASPPVTALTGAWSAATASRVSDKVAILRSRRD